MKKYLIILLMVLVLACDKEGNINEIPFNQTNNLPIVTLEINGTNCKFLVDTGSTLSIIDETKKSKYRFYTIESNNTIEGIGGLENYLIAYGLVARYKDSIVNVDFVSFDISSLGSKIGVSGILGSDFLEINGYSVDFKNNKIIR